MLSIGEFSNICKVSPKTLRHYAKIGLLLPDKINPVNGYRYYSISQLETMLLINRLKSYNFSLKEIKTIIQSEEKQGENLYTELVRKKQKFEKQIQEYNNILKQMNDDLLNLEQGNSIMSYMESIDLQLTEVPRMNLLSIRKRVHEHGFEEAYGHCFGSLSEKIQNNRFTVLAPPMVLFHSAQYESSGLDTEFAIPVKEHMTGTRDFTPGLCLKTILHGSYSNLPSVYTRQFEWAKREGYESTNALFEVYVTDPSQVSQESELITEVYYPVKKKISKQ